MIDGKRIIETRREMICDIGDTFFFQCAAVDTQTREICLSIFFKKKNNNNNINMSHDGQIVLPSVVVQPRGRLSKTPPWLRVAQRRRRRILYSSAAFNS